MIAAILAREWKAMRRLAVACLVVWTALVVVAMTLGVDRQRRFDEAVRQYVATDEAQLAQYRDRAAAIAIVRAGGQVPGLTLHKNEFNWGPTQAMYVAAWLPMKAVALAPPRAPLGIGESDVHAQAYEIPVGTRAPRAIVEPNASPLTAASWRLDPTFLLVYVLPLFVLALSFDLTASERDEGLLPILLAEPVSFRTWLFAKVVVRAGLVLLAVGLAAVIAWAALGRGLEHAWPIATWAVAASLYGFIWLGLAAVVNGRRAGVERAAVTLAALWLALVVVLPAVCQLVAAAVSPVPSRASFAEEERALLVREERRFDKLAPGERDAVVERFLSDHPELRGAVRGRDTFGYYYLSRLAWHEQIRARLSDLESRFVTPARQQEAMISWLRFVSPASLIYEIATEVAGTGRARYRDVVAQAKAYEARYKAFLWPLIVGEHTFSVAQFAAIPRFTYGEPAWGAVAPRVVAPVLGLVAWLATLTLAARQARPSIGAS